MTLSKEHIKDSIRKHLNLSTKESAALFETLIETIKKALESGEDVMITGFGRFSVKNKNERRGKNPQTGDDIIIEQRKAVTFKCSEKLKDRINDGQ
jgi:integration host factor subunit alpha